MKHATKCDEMTQNESKFRDECDALRPTKVIRKLSATLEVQQNSITHQHCVFAIENVTDIKWRQNEPKLNVKI